MNPRFRYSHVIHCANNFVPRIQCSPRMHLAVSVQIAHIECARFTTFARSRDRFALGGRSARLSSLKPRASWGGRIISESCRSAQPILLESEAEVVQGAYGSTTATHAFG